jgi:hypothetical protein
VTAATTAMRLRAAGHTVAYLGGTGVQVISLQDTRPSRDAARILRDLHATEINAAEELHGREYSGRTPDGTWVYVPCRPLTPYVTIRGDQS